MLYTPYLESDCTFVILDIRQLHHQEIYFLRFVILCSLAIQLQTDVVAVFVLLCQVNNLLDGIRILSPELETDVVQDENQNFDIRFRKALHQQFYAVYKQLRGHGLKEVEVKQAVENIFDFGLAVSLDV